MVRDRIACLQCGGEFILDGFPRTLGQGEYMKQLIDGEGLTRAAVVNHQLPVGAPNLRSMQGDISFDRTPSKECRPLRSL